jgi:hypothetical protein
MYSGLRLSLFVSLSCLLLQTRAETEYALHHRIYFPTIDKHLPFALRGTVRVSDGAQHATLEAPESLESDLRAFAQIVTDQPDIDEVYYQVALQRDVGSQIDPATWSVSSVKAVRTLSSICTWSSCI